MIRRAALALLLGLAACAGPGGAGALCGGADEATVAEAIGAPSVELSQLPGDEIAAVQCVWRPDAASERFLSATVLKPADDLASAASSEAVFEDELRALEAEFTELRVIGGVGDAAVMGFADVTAAGFSGGLIARDGEAVLVMRIEGLDPAAFESVARDLVSRM